MPDTSKTLAAAAAVLLAASLTAAGTTQVNQAERHAPGNAAPVETSRGPVGRTTGQSVTATGPDSAGQ